MFTTHQINTPTGMTEVTSQQLHITLPVADYDDLYAAIAENATETEGLTDVLSNGHIAEFMFSDLSGVQLWDDVIRFNLSNSNVEIRAE